MLRQAVRRAGQPRTSPGRRSRRPRAVGCSIAGARGRPTRPCGRAVPWHPRGGRLPRSLSCAAGGIASGAVSATTGTSASVRSPAAH